ncbi:PepSY domain-containing protein [Symbiobacterium terraclitae]|uniref:PepSY domain-containing protein n=1 Tax=Symbiobacterium terraclitae TaxID=557451 RepID=UPI0035B51E95
MRRILALSLALSLALLSACTTATPADLPAAGGTGRGAGEEPEPRRPQLVEHRLGELRRVEHGEGFVLLLPAQPTLTATVSGAEAVHWLLYQDTDARSNRDVPLAVLDGEAVGPHRWELNWTDAPAESVRLVLCAVPQGDFPAGEEVPRVGGRPCLGLQDTRVLVLGPDESPYLTEEQAVAKARLIEPDGPWVAKFEEAYTRFGSEDARGRPAWVLEALYPYGNRITVAIDALTGERLAVVWAEPPHFGREPVPLSREEAVAAALEQLGDSNLQVVDATYTEEYEWRGHTYFAWVLRLAPGTDEGNEITAVIHAYTGTLLTP